MSDTLARCIASFFVGMLGYYLKSAIEKTLDTERKDGNRMLTLFSAFLLFMGIVMLLEMYVR